MLEPFLDAVGPQDLDRLDALRTVVSSGESLGAPLARRFEALFGERTLLLNTWGLTEVSVDSTAYESRAAPDGPTVPIGRPMDNCEVCILDERLAPVPVGTTGFLYAGGDGIARGYLHDPARTAQAFVPHPFASGRRLYATGDRGVLRASGDIVFLGRVDRQVKLRGVRIELGEIEAVLEKHPEVAQAVVGVVTAEAGDERLVAHIVASNTTEGDLRVHMAGRLPAVLVPAYFVLLDEFPRLPNGKLDRSRLSAPAVPDPGTLGDDVATPAERAIADIWSDLLGYRIAVHADFFSVGGHSLLAMRAITRMRDAFGSAELPLSMIFDAPTAAGTAVLVEWHLQAEIEAMSDEEVARQTAGLGSASGVTA